MGRTYRRDDHHNSWGKSLRDKRQRSKSERFRDKDGEQYAGKKRNKKFNQTDSYYYEEENF
ncbi:hypothetical protein [Synechococcus phage S-H38]|jgi:hypothetical protein|uniref:Uncharacterized protein n=1 Tax=Synechococcus phage S-H38 TaxID=2783673 RepID=A0A873WF09_9CAUD|nr:hypothetical protein PQC14_gp145 [Synechococcus phage S-H38]QPB07916.1 hypothetical protein [Synechococcus phage S-H38]